MIRGTEYILQESPFIVRRQVRWADCDPAGVVYTGRFPEYVLGAVSLFSNHIAGNDRLSLGKHFGVDTPCKGMRFEFSASLWPYDEIDIACYVSEIRTKSYDITCEARRLDGTKAFHAVFSPICIRQDERVGTPIPEAMRTTLNNHSTPAWKD